VRTQLDFDQQEMAIAALVDEAAHDHRIGDRCTTPVRGWYECGCLHLALEVPRRHLALPGSAEIAALPQGGVCPPDLGKLPASPAVLVGKAEALQRLESTGAAGFMSIKLWR